jgi:hypothetical protein
VSESRPATTRDPHQSERVNSLVLLATKEDMREFKEDPCNIPSFYQILEKIYVLIVLVQNFTGI